MKSKLASNIYTVLIIVAILIVLVPCTYFAYILFQATSNTGKPIIGNRFNNDLDPAITSDDIKAIEESIRQLSEVENVEITLKTATLRITVDLKDDTDKQLIPTYSEKIFARVEQRLPIRTYFTADNAKNQYDLEVHVFNFIEGKNKENYQYYIALKSSRASELLLQDVSDSKNPELAESIRQDLINKNKEETDGEDIEVGGEDIEDDEDYIVEE